MSKLPGKSHKLCMKIMFFFGKVDKAEKKQRKKGTRWQLNIQQVHNFVIY